MNYSFLLFCVEMFPKPISCIMSGSIASIRNIKTLKVQFTIINFVRFEKKMETRCGSSTINHSS